MGKRVQNTRYSMIAGNALDILQATKERSVDVIFADPPYFLSGNGTTCKGGKRVSVKKGEWDEPKTPGQMFQFNLEWLQYCHDILKETGTIWVCGSMHNISSVGFAMQKIGYHSLNHVTWEKPAPPPNLGRKCLTHSHETIIWARKRPKSKHFFNYEKSRSYTGKQMKDVWTISRAKKHEMKYGKHPTQKPVELLQRILSVSCPDKGVVLDPFQGMGTTGKAAMMEDRQLIYYGIDKDPLWVERARKRLNDDRTS